MTRALLSHLRSSRTHLSTTIICRMFLLALGVLSLSLSSKAQDTSASAKARPTFKLLHAEEDWSSLCDPPKRTEYLDRIKCIAFSPSSPAYLSIGGETRQRGEYFDHPVWGQDPPDSGYLLQRYMLHADLHATDRLRFFTEFESGLETGRDGGPRPVIDEDQLFVHQAFVNLKLVHRPSTKLTLRTGRQELSFGSDRLVAIREGPNVRQNFDGFRLTWNQGRWTVDGLATKYSENNPGVFDDRPNNAYSFWGVYATHPVFANRKATLDLYYLGTDKKKAVYNRGTGRDQRETFGTRLAGKRGKIDFDDEAIFQAGWFGSGDVRAWAATTNTGYTFDPSANGVKTRLGINVGIASGDKNPAGKTLGTFNALFPKGAYFSEAELVGPYNVIVARPSVKFELPHNLTVWPDAEFLWRESTQDGLYAVPGVLIRKSGYSTAAYIGAHANLQVEWHPTRHFTYTVIYLHFFPGAFLKQTKPDKDVNFVAPWITYTF